MTRLSRGRLAASIVFALVLLPGCGKPAVSGKVTLDGQPVDGGIISFLSEGPKEQANADIVGGSYQFAAGKGPVSGKHRVEILWNKKTGRKVPVPGDVGTTMEEKLQVIPAKYNTASTLTAEVKGGANTLDFTLTSK